MKLITTRTELTTIEILAPQDRIDYIISILKSFKDDKNSLDELEKFLASKNKIDFCTNNCEFVYGWSTGCKFSGFEAFGYILSIGIGGNLDIDINLIVNGGVNNVYGERLINKYGEDFFSEENCKKRLFNLFKELVFSLD